MRRILDLPAGWVLRHAVVVVLVALGIAGCGGDTPDASVRPGTATGVNATTEASETRTPQGSGSPGVFDDRILFGQSAAFSGLAGQLGAGMKLGIEAAFAEANRNGGVHGRQLELTSLDDTYEPELAIANTTQLIDDGVFALIGAVGTPTSRSATPVAREAKIPYIAPFTGAAFLRDASNLPNVVNMRSSYNQETEEMVARLTGDLGITRIAVMYQDDSFGRAGYQGAREALNRRDMQPVSVGLYPRNTTAVKTGLLDLKRGDPQAVIIIGAYRPVASLIAWARHIGEDWEFMTVSFVGSNALAEELGSGGAGVYVTQVVPFPTDDSVPIVSSYLESLSEHDSDAIPGFVSLEGYLAGRLAIAGLERCGRDVDRQCFLEQLYSAEPIDLDGFVLRYGDNDNQGSDTVFLTTIADDGGYVPIKTLNPRRRASQ
ncbi:MAG: ABC transporter substrate-binding protein [Chloroflexi bacterium]|nr:ABC transporter substrate-binding protein [Chloroflexota bacterium]